VPTTLEARARPRPAPEFDRLTEIEVTWEPESPSQVPAAAVQELIVKARQERAELSRLSPRRAYYVGVEAAADQVLHPGLEWIRKVGWLDRLNPAFVSGFLETTALLTPLWSWPSDEPGSDRATS